MRRPSAAASASTCSGGTSTPSTSWRTISGGPLAHANASQLELEITESVAMQDPEASRALLEDLSALGIAIAIDDFGTGYSSLAYLKRFPVDKVKIDRTFVAEIPRDREHGAIVSAIVAMAHALDIEVIAEGVEDEKQREYLKRCGCDYIQGYLIGRPADSDAAAKDYR